MNAFEMDARMTEAFVERVAEKQMDRFDRKLLSGEYSQAEYDHQVALLDEWTAREYRAVMMRRKGQ